MAAQPAPAVKVKVEKPKKQLLALEAALALPCPRCKGKMRKAATTPADRGQRVAHINIRLVCTNRECKHVVYLEPVTVMYHPEGIR